MAVNIDVFFPSCTVYASGKSETPAATYPKPDFFLSAVTGVTYLSSGRVRIGHVMTCSQPWNAPLTSFHHFNLCQSFEAL